MTKFEDYLNEKLKDPELRSEYDALESEFALKQSIIDKEKETEITQNHQARTK